MTRVTDFARSQALLAQLQSIQQRSFVTEQQVSTGKKAQTFRDLSQDTGVLLSAKALEARTQQFMKTGQQVLGRLELQNVQLESLAGAADDLRQKVLSAVSIEKGIGFMAEVSQIFETAVGILNSKVDGKYIYGGTRTDVPPVNVTTLSDLVAAPSGASVFVNNSLKQSVRLDESQVVEFGVLASDIGTDLMEAIKRIADYDANPATGPFQNTLTAAQRDFLQNEVANLAQIADDLINVVAENGSKHQQVQDALDRHDATNLYIQKFISDIEDVDIAEAITRLNQDQAAMEASLRLISTLNRLSLLDFL